MRKTHILLALSFCLPPLLACNVLMQGSPVLTAETGAQPTSSAERAPAIYDEWNGIPLMPISNSTGNPTADARYIYTASGSVYEASLFYNRVMPDYGWEALFTNRTVDETEDLVPLTFFKGEKIVIISLFQLQENKVEATIFFAGGLD